MSFTLLKPFNVWPPFVFGDVVPTVDVSYVAVIAVYSNPGVQGVNRNPATAGSYRNPGVQADNGFPQTNAVHRNPGTQARGDA